MAFNQSGLWAGQQGLVFVYFELWIDQWTNEKLKGGHFSFDNNQSVVVDSDGVEPSCHWVFSEYLKVPSIEMPTIFPI